MSVMDLTDRTFGEWHVLGPGTRKHYWLCECSCKKVVREVYYGSLTSGRSTNCGHKFSEKIIDLKGQQFGPYIAELYLGGKNSDWLCRCTTCNTTRNIRSAKLRSGNKLICPNCRPTANFIDLTGQTFERWRVKEYAGNGKWLCECSCDAHTERLVNGQSLRIGESKSCGCLQVERDNYEVNLKDRQFGDWTVLEYAGNSKWLCLCSCGNLGEITTRSLNNGQSQSCGSYKHIKSFVDLTNQHIGKWTVLDYVGHGMWNCECECGRRKIVFGDALKRKQSLSCGACKRKDWQIEAIRNKEQFISILHDAVESMDTKLTVSEIAYIFNINYMHAHNLIKKYAVEDLVTHIDNESKFEQEVYEFISGLIDVELHNRHLLNGYELDVYCAEQKVAFEVNGSYWHSTDYKDKYYHQQKTLACLTKDIQLIHIFEHEWYNKRQQPIIKDIIKKALHLKVTEINSNNTEVRTVDKLSTEQFVKTNSLVTDYDYNFVLGLYYDNQLTATMLIKRYKERNISEIVSYCTAQNISVINGFQKLFLYYISMFPLDTVYTYSDLTKQSNKLYNTCNMELETILEPDYVYVNMHNLNVLFKDTLQTEAKQLGWSEDTSSLIDFLRSKNYKQIYDCGKAQYIYRPNSN